MQKLESLNAEDALIKQIFENDIQAQRDSDIFLLVLPAGISGHIEAGASYGMGKKCYAIGVSEKTETLYGIFEQIFPDLKAFETWLKKM
jgi:arginine deiminase